MIRLFFYLIILALLGAVGLYGYSFVMQPEPVPIQEEIKIDAS